MEKQYGNELEQICLTDESKKVLIKKLVSSQSNPSKSLGVKRFLVAAVLCILLASTTALAIGIPILQTHFDGNGYWQSATTLGRSVTQNGWTLTLTDCVGDDRYLYFGIEVAAPKGTVLDEEAYRFEKEDFSFLGMKDYVMAWRITQVPDDDQTDNLLHFILWIEGGHYDNTFNGKRMSLSFKNLYHTGEWNEEQETREKLYDHQAKWRFNAIKINYPDNAIRLKPDVSVPVLDVEAKVTSVEVSPIGVVVTIEGDELKGHHEWVRKDAADGWYSCNEQPTIALYDKEGNILEPDAYAAPFGIRGGSGCWGGNYDSNEEGKLRIVQSYGYLLDMEALDYIEVCGVSIPLK